MQYDSFTVSNPFKVDNLDAFIADLEGHGLGVNRHGSVGKITIIPQDDEAIRIELLNPFEWLDKSRVKDSTIPDEKFHDNLPDIIADHISLGSSTTLVRDNYGVAIVTGVVKVLRLRLLADEAAAKLVRAQRRSEP